MNIQDHGEHDPIPATMSEGWHSVAKHTREHIAGVIRNPQPADVTVQLQHNGLDMSVAEWLAS